MMQSEFVRIMTAVMDVGEMMLTSGAEVNRVEDTLNRILHAYGCVRVDVFTITSSIVVTARTADGESFTQTRRIQDYVTDMYKIERCNALSRKICKSALPAEELQKEVEGIRKEKSYPGWVRLLAYGGISAVFSIFK